MESLRLSFNAVLPLVLYMAAGYLARCLGMLNEKDVLRFNKAVFHFFLTVSLFRSVYSSDLSVALDMRLILFCFVGVLAVIAVSLLIARKICPERGQRGVVAQGIFRSNFVLIGLPLAASLVPGGDTGPIAILSAVVVPTYNVVAVVVLSVYAGEKVKPGVLLKKILKNPLIISSLLGILFLLLEIRLPTPLMTTINAMANAATPMMLFLLGAFFHFDSLRSHGKQLAVVVVTRLILVPAVMLPLARALGFQGMAFAGIVATFASSTAVSSFTMTQQIGGDDVLAGDIVVLTSVLSALSLFLWCSIFHALGSL